MTRLRFLLRRLEIGSLLLKLGVVKEPGIPALIAIARAKRKFLPLITELPPIPCGAEAETHILLHHARVYDGAWAMYSLAFFSSTRYRFVVHDDGSLQESDLVLLKTVFPGIRIVSRLEADASAQRFFAKHGLSRCEKFRNSLVFALKLFDPFWYVESERFILIDSDVLFFSRPNEVIQSQSSGPPRYQVDLRCNYVIDPIGLQDILKFPCVENFNPGVVVATRPTMDFEKVEAWLGRSEFWSGADRGHYYGELTLWAMLLSLAKAKPFSDQYQICPRNFSSPALTFGHYCGGHFANSVFYQQAIPFVGEKIRSSLALPPKHRVSL